MLDVELCHRWLDLLWNGDADGLEEVVTDLATREVVGTFPTRSRSVVGQGPFAQAVRQCREPFDEIQFAIAIGPVLDDELVVARWTATGRLDGRAFGHNGHDLLCVTAAGRLSAYTVTSLPQAPHRRRPVAYRDDQLRAHVSGSGRLTMPDTDRAFDPRWEEMVLPTAK